MVQWYHGSEVLIPFPQPLKLICQQCYLSIRRVPFITTPCYWCDLLQDLGVPTLLNKLSFFPPFRLSFRGTSDLPPFPFSGTYHVMRNNVFRRPNLTGQLYFVCQICWAHVRHVSTLCEPCGGCELLDSIGYYLGYHIL